MGRCRLPERSISDFSRLRDYGDLASAEYLEELLSLTGLELHSRAIVSSAKECWVVDLSDEVYFEKRCLSTLDSQLRYLNAVQTSLYDWLESGRGTLLYSLAQLCFDDITEGLPEEPLEPSVRSYAVLVSAVVLLSLVYHYLTGNVDRGGSKAYSRSSLDFRDVYVAIVLFLGAYVWIKFREVAPKGVLRRKLVDKQGVTREVYDARLTPPKWNGQEVRKLELGRFATPQEAHNKFLIAAFYYDRDAGLLDGWFQVPPKSDEERSLTGLELRAWVIGQAKKVYEDFKNKAEAKEKAEAALLLQELLEGCEDHVPRGHDEISVDACGASLWNSAEPQQPALVSQADNSAMGVTTLANHGLECASDSFDEMHEGLGLPNGHNLGFGEASSLPVSQPPPNTESGTSLNGSDQLELLQTSLGTFQEHSSDQRPRLEEFGAQVLQFRGSEPFFLLQTRLNTFQQQISDQGQKIQEFGAQILQLHHQQQLQESRIQNPPWLYQSYPQEQQLQDVNEGVPGFEMEMEQSWQQPNYWRFMTPPPDGGETLEAFPELDTSTYV